MNRLCLQPMVCQSKRHPNGLNVPIIQPCWDRPTVILSQVVLLTRWGPKSPQRRLGYGSVILRSPCSRGHCALKFRNTSVFFSQQRNGELLIYGWQIVVSTFSLYLLQKYCIMTRACNGDILSRQDGSDHAIQNLWFRSRLWNWRNDEMESVCSWKYGLTSSPDRSLC